MTLPEELLRREELLEQASLDALGLLDEFEAEHYARSFHAAPASVQEEVRRIQAAVATDPALLSDEEPPADLRARVLGSVEHAIDEEARELKPIATIGARPARRQVGRAIASAELVEQERWNLRMRASERQLSIWRAAAVGLAASLVAAIVWMSTLNAKVDGLERLVQNAATFDTVEKQLGPSFRAVLNDSNRTAHALTSSDGSVAGNVFHLASDDRVFILAVGLPSNAAYSVRATTTSGPLELGEFTSGAGLTGCWLASANLSSAGVLWIDVLDAQGRLVLSSKRL